MQITYRHADATRAPERLFLHGCNAHGVMNSGIAKAVREKWPLSFRVYNMIWKDLCDQGEPHLPLGEVYWTVERHDGSNESPLYHWRIFNRPETMIVANCITQRDYGRDPKRVYVDYDAVARCLKKINALAIAYNIPAIAMPRIGCGLANGSWDRIEPLVRRHIVDADVVVYDWPAQVPETQYET
jgi:O-acetyl-ADP-ribose deacetylase (regulator of RNase III)